MFWTLDTRYGGPVTLCDVCALQATNMGMGGDITFTSMEEADIMLGALMAMTGQAFEIDSAESGTCQNCKLEVAA